VSVYSDLILAHASLVVYYRFGEASGTTADDIGPNNLDATLAGSGLTYSVAGAIANDVNTAITSNGTGNVLSRTDNNALDLADTLSLEIWHKRSATGATQTIISKQTNAYGLQFTTGNTVRLVKVGVATVAESSTTITDTTTFHHIVVTKSGAARKIYIDGVDVTASLPGDSTLADNASSLLIGQSVAGTYDEAAIYNAVLTPTEVLNHYRVGRALLTPATETDSAQALDKDKSKTLGVGTTTNSAQALSAQKRKTVTSGTTTSAAQALDVDKSKTAGVASETDTAQALVYTKPIFKTLTPATETDEAQAFDSDRFTNLTSASETDEAQALSYAKQASITPATESDEAQPLSISGVQDFSITPAEETDEAQALSFTQGTPQTPGGWYRTPLRADQRRKQYVLILPASELDEAQALGFTKTPSAIQIEDDELLLLA
jgi:hypothetical protein